VVRVSVSPDLVVEVQDDGVGMPAQAAALSGLRNLEHRAAVRGGTLRLTALRDGGTHVQWSVPLPGRDHRP